MRHAHLLSSAAALMLASCGVGSSPAPMPTPTPAPSPSPSPTPTPVAQSSYLSPADDTPCVAGTWVEAIVDPTDPNSKIPTQAQSDHFAIHYRAGVISPEDATATLQQMEFTRSFYIDTLKFPEPDCHRTTKRKTNMFFETGYGLSGGVDGRGQMGIWAGPTAFRDHFGMGHEFAHAMQASTGGLSNSAFGSWFFETHANFMALQLPEYRNITHCGELAANNPHLYFGSSRVRYCLTPFFEFLKNRYGYQLIQDIWRRSPARDGDPIRIIRELKGWTQEQLNDEFGRWAMQNVNWDYTDPDGTDHGAVYRANFGDNDSTDGEMNRLLRLTTLDPVDLPNRRFAVPAAWAPQRWGYNMIKLVPDSGATSVTVSFRGLVQSAPATTTLPGLADEPSSVPNPASGWRWGLVAIGADGKSRYGDLMRGASAQTTFAVRPDDRKLYMVVLGAPTEFQYIRFDQPYYSVYRFPWMAQFAGAMPDGFQANAPAPFANAHRHANGGGWVSDSATVDASAYVGPYARVYRGSVLGNARLEDHAMLVDGTVRDNARLAAVSIIRRNTVVKDNARTAMTFAGLGFFEDNIVLAGTAQMIGDVEKRGEQTPFTRGVFYGFVDDGRRLDPRYGANLTAPVPEVTFQPNYVWPQ